MAHARIILTASDLGRIEQKEFVFEKPTQCVIGRAEDCAIQLPADFGHMDVSRHHCVLEIDPPSIRVRDLGSRNGTCVNGKKIGQRPDDNDPPDDTESHQRPAQELKDGDALAVGTTFFRVGVVVDADRPGRYGASR